MQGLVKTNPTNLLILVIIVAACLRLINLNNFPPALNWDEVSHGYNAYSILKTGSDEWGQVLPLANFRAYGDYPLPLYMYLSMPGILLFDLNEFSVRLPSVVFGVFLVLITFYLTILVTKNKWLSLMAALLVAISPWTLLISRQALQATPAISFLAAGIRLFLKGIEEKKYWTFIGTVSLGISAYAYHNTRIIAPLIFIVLIIIYRKQILNFKKNLVILLVIAAFFFVPLVFIITSSAGSARSVWVGILDEGAINRINQARGNTTLVNPLPAIVHNKATYFIETATTNYLGYFSPNFLGINGGTHYQFSVPNRGIIYLVTLPFFYIGLFFLITKFMKNSLEKRFLLIWLLIAPIPASLTRDPYQVVRATTMLPAVFIVICLGFGEVLRFVKNLKFKQLFIGIFLASLLLSSVNYFYHLFMIYPKEYSSAWQYGYKQAVDFVNKQIDKYDKIYITKKYGEPHEFLLFYSRYDPAKYKSDANLVRYERTNWYWVDSFDKFVFLNDWEVVEKVDNEQRVGNNLLITSPDNYPKGSRLLETINFLDGKPAFDIVELPQVQ